MCKNYKGKKLDLNLQEREREMKEKQQLNKCGIAAN